VVDNADVMLMQNWEHVQTVLKSVSHIPTEQHGADFMRIREWYLNGLARCLRQTIILSAFPFAEANALLSNKCSNIEGSVICRRSHYEGQLPFVIPQIRQIYTRIPFEDLSSDDDRRFRYFAEEVYPGIKESVQSGILVFIPSYFDFVRLRNFLRKDMASVASLCEYTTTADVSRARANFFHGRRRILLYTERAHFYHRYRIRGIQRLIFYGVPHHAHYYSELLNLSAEGNASSCTVLFSKLESLQLERVVGSKRAKRLLKGSSSSHIFV